MEFGAGPRREAGGAPSPRRRLAAERSERPAEWFTVARPKVLGRLHVCGLGPLVACLGVIGDLRAFRERVVAVTHDCAVMHEQVLRLVVGRDEPKALVVAEPLYGSSSHCVSSGLDS